MITYFINLCWQHMSTIKYKGLRLIPAISASNELFKYKLDVEDCKEILESGYGPRKRAKNTTEKWFDIGNKTYNVVIVKVFNQFYGENIYLIIHVGKFTKKRLK